MPLLYCAAATERREHRIHAAVLIGVDHVLVVGIEGNGDFLHLGLGLPPGGVGAEKHVAGRLKAADDIGTHSRALRISTWEAGTTGKVML